MRRKQIYSRTLMNDYARFSRTVYFSRMMIIPKDSVLPGNTVQQYIACVFPLMEWLISKGLGIDR